LNSSNQLSYLLSQMQPYMGGGQPTNTYFDVPSLCNEAVERNFRGDPNAVGAVISKATYDLVW
jgi:hypothetical protein